MHFDISPSRQLYDEPVRIRLVGLEPDSPVTLRAGMRDPSGELWESRAELAANASGQIDLTTDSPHAGTYTGLDPMGLFWSMYLVPGQKDETLRAIPAEPRIVTLDALVDSRVAASVKIERLAAAPDVKSLPVRDDGLAGTFFWPSTASQSPALIVLGGSEGGMSERPAALFASRGYACLALAYFAYEHLPPRLESIPLEYFETAISWLKRHKSIKPDRIGVVGGSLGASLALLLGATFPDIKAVVGSSPGNFIVGSDGVPTYPGFTYRGQPLPFLPEVDDDFTREHYKQDFWSFTQIVHHLMEDRAAYERSLIPVEKIQGPVLLVSGQDDKVWPSSMMADSIMERLKQHNHPYASQHLSYAGAGHISLIPHSPTTEVANGRYLFGGDPMMEAHAVADAWPRVREFLNTHLNR